jgi:hypothetical protein
MSGTFVGNGNQSMFDAIAFKKILLKKGVAANEFYDNGHVAMFKEVSTHLMSLYLAQRPKQFHREALATAKQQYEEDFSGQIPPPYCSA